MTDKKVTIEITKEACGQLRAFLMYDREGTGEGYSDFILKAINIRRMVADLEADNAAQVAALQAENQRLAQQLKDREAQLDRLSDKLYLEKQAQANQREASALLSRQLRKAEKALQQIAAGNPAPPGKWLSDIEMADIARKYLGEK